MNAAAIMNGMAGVNPGLMAGGGLNPRMVAAAGGGAGLTGQPLFAQVSSPGCYSNLMMSVLSYGEGKLFS